MGQDTRSSRRWLSRQRRDRYVRAAHREGHVSRAYYKLQQLDQRFSLLRNGQQILELGAAPGGWTAYLAERVSGGRIIAVDPLPLTRSAGNVEVVRGCLGEPETDEMLARLLEEGASGDRDGCLDLVLSDMAPNMSGVRIADQAMALHLAELASTAALRWLIPGGALVVKIYQGEGLQAWLRVARRRFGKVSLAKPSASRPESRESYVVARQFGGKR